MLLKIIFSGIFIKVSLKIAFFSGTLIEIRLKIAFLVALFYSAAKMIIFSGTFSKSS
jgi:hypothetical protein